MSVSELSSHASEWMRGTGPESDVIISSRVRLARNLAGFLFLSRASQTQQQEILRLCHQHIFEADAPACPTKRILWVDLSHSSSLDRQLLVERHLISRQHSKGGAPRGVAVSGDESASIMVNEEDHLRLQVLYSGMRLDQCYARANELDDTLEARLDFGYCSELGYFTACPTNLGTGIRVSVMLHLPALKLTGEVEKVRRATRDMHLAVRGFYGEGTESIGDFFQISNQSTLGRSEEEILSDFQDVIIPKVIEYEQKARRTLVEKRPLVLDDKVHRALGTLSSARMLGSEEALYMLSLLRLGITLERIDSIPITTVNELFLLTQPAHLQKIVGQTLNGSQRRECRARFVRERLGV